jgi:Tfp pilus assembly protein PilF
MSELAERLFEQALTAIRGRATDHAKALLVEVIKLKPEMYEAWLLRGNLLHSTEQPFEALLHYDRAISINGKRHDAWNNRGLAFGDIGMFAAAEDCFRKSLAIAPSVEPHMGLANMFCTLMRLEDAATEYRAAISIERNPEASFNLGVTLLGLGQWDEGFGEYEQRWLNTPMPPRAYRDYPKWTGEDLTGKRIVLYPEQGYGDEIMALRFAGLLTQRYPIAEIVVQARGPMLRLVKGNSAFIEYVVPMHADEQPAADFSCPLLDVPMVLGLTPKDAPFMGQWTKYLRAPDQRMVDTWRKRLKANLPPGLNVGLCWSSGSHMNTAKASALMKSIPLPRLKGLALPGVNLISLQKPAETIPNGFPITADWIDDCHDFADTAALIEALDLVISVDTSVAHLAGALGKPVWNFVRFSGYWPWLAPSLLPNPHNAIWYPSMRLLRQPGLSNWVGPIETATAWLRSEVEAWKQRPESKASA